MLEHQINLIVVIYSIVVIMRTIDLSM